LGFKGNRTAVGKTVVESGAVVEGLDVVKDGVARLGEGGETLVVNDFVFKTAQKDSMKAYRSNCLCDSWKR
jgi:hypothetical protein